MCTLAKGKLLSSLCLVLLFTCGVLSKSVRSVRSASSRESGSSQNENAGSVEVAPADEGDEEDLYERLKLGDHEAWSEMGPMVVDLVQEMIDNGVAESPVHALLLLFWPNISKHEQDALLRRVEALVSADDRFEGASSSFQSKTPKVTAVNHHRRAAEDLLEDEGREEAEPRRIPLMRHSDGIINHLTGGDRDDSTW